MDARIEERDEAGNLIMSYAGSPSTDEKGRSGERWDVIVCRRDIPETFFLFLPLQFKRSLFEPL